MGTIITAILPFVGKLLLSSLDWWIKKQKHDQEMLKSYHEFLKQIDKAGLANVANYLAAEDALKAKQEEIRKRLRKKKN